MKKRRKSAFPRSEEVLSILSWLEAIPPVLAAAYREGRWRTNNGRALLPSEMDDGHLRNTLRFLRRYQERVYSSALEISDDDPVLAPIKDALRPSKVGSMHPMYSRLLDEAISRGLDDPEERSATIDVAWGESDVGALAWCAINFPRFAKSLMLRRRESGEGTPGGRRRASSGSNGDGGAPGVPGRFRIL